ncbi:MAG: hypothetical protein ABR559_10425 [Gemmatimonadota bacterium]
MTRGCTLLAWVLLTSLAGTVPGRAAQTAPRAADFAAGQAAAARGDDEAAYDHFRDAYDPTTDGAGELAALAATAARLGDLPRFHALLDSVVGAGPGYPYALQYWAALGLQQGTPPDAVRAEFEQYLDAHGDDGAALLRFVRVLQAHDALPEAMALLDGAPARGLSPAAVALPLGEVRAARGDSLGAAEAYLVGLRDDPSAIPLAVKLEELIDAWPAMATLPEVTRRLEAARPTAPRAAAALLTRAHALRAEWPEALAATREPALSATSRGDLLRRLIASARRAGSLDTAAALADSLVALGPPAALPADRLLAADISSARGAHGAASAAYRQAADEGIAGAGVSALAAEVAAARAAGDPPGLAVALARAAAGGVGAGTLSVPQGDLWLSRGAADSALAAYARGIGERATGPAALEALTRARLAQALLRDQVPLATVAAIGAALIEAPAAPGVAAERFEALSGLLAADDSTAVAVLMVRGLVGEWRGRSGDAAGASVALAAAASPASGPEAAALLLAAARWAAAADDAARARTLWREVVERYGATPYALEARRLLAAPTLDGAL